MQIYAFEQGSRLVHVLNASRAAFYTCPECQGTVKVRGGRMRQPHFYHPDASSCGLRGKSLTHLQVQYALQKLLGSEQVHLEHHFPAIGRIADVAWPEQKLVFEVQISPISSEEVKARNRDYQTEGYQVVWILHDSRFNRSRLTTAEIALRFSPHYFTNMNAYGKGFFYDQHSFIRFKRRRNRSPRFPVHFKHLAQVTPKQLPSHFPLERKQWPIAFSGDLFHRKLPWQSPPRTLSAPFLRFFRLLHHLLLEKTTF